MKHFYKEHKKFLSDTNLKFIEEVILNDHFPFFIKQSATTNLKGEPNNEPFLKHIILHNLESKRAPDIVNSPHYDLTLDILNNFSRAIKQEVHFFTRICYNLTFANGVKKCGVHRDHKYPYKQVIIYLNNCDKNSKTIILDEKGKTVREITPEKYKGVCFDGLSHYHIFPKTGFRLALVGAFV